MPKDSTLAVKQDENIAYIVGEGEFSFIKIPIGTDTFVMDGDKINY